MPISTSMSTPWRRKRLLNWTDSGTLERIHQPKWVLDTTTSVSLNWSRDRSSQPKGLVIILFLCSKRKITNTRITGHHIKYLTKPEASRQRTWIQIFTVDFWRSSVTKLRETLNRKRCLFLPWKERSKLGQSGDN
mgnify:CR=1 FL=1